MAGRKSDFTLPTNTLDELFSSQEERDEAKLSKIRDIPLEEIDDFPDHPFKVREDEDMFQLVESIKERGVITPATVRQKEDGRYELISGHRRKKACELAGFETLRCEVVDLDRDEATILMVESNFQAYQVKIKGNLSRSVSLGTDAIGNITRIDNAIEKIPERLEAKSRELSTLEQQFATAKAEVEKPFDKEEELTEKTRLSLLLCGGFKPDCYFCDVYNGFRRRRSAYRCQQPVRFHLRLYPCDWSDPARFWYRSGRTFPEIPRSLAACERISDAGGRYHYRFCERNPHSDYGLTLTQTTLRGVSGLFFRNAPFFFLRRCYKIE